MSRMICNNNKIIAYYEHQLQHQMVHYGSVPGHIVIPWDCEAADLNLFNDYFSDSS